MSSIRQVEPPERCLRSGGTVMPGSYGPIEISHETLSGEGYFHRARFTGPVVLDHVLHDGAIWFENCEFLGPVMVAGCNISLLSFRWCTFKQDVRVSSAFDRLEARRCVFFGTGGFQFASVEPGGRIKAPWHDGEANFSHSYFLTDARFENAMFHGETWFWGTSFLGPVNFHGARFGMPTNFAEVGAIALEPNDFYRILSGLWDGFVAHRVQLGSNSPLMGNEQELFEKLREAGVIRRSDEGDADFPFPDARAWKEARDNFSGPERELFEATVETLRHPMFSVAAGTDFTGLHPQSSAPHFSRCDLSRSRFLGTITTEMNFEDVKWAVKQRLFGRRLACADEALARTPEDFGQVRQVYSGLRRAYERQGEPQLAEQFQIAEYEMARRAGEHWRFIRLLIDEHGTNAALPLAWLALLNLCLFPLVFMLLGAATTFGSSEAYAINAAARVLAHFTLPDSANVTVIVALALQAASAAWLAKSVLGVIVKRRLNVLQKED
jgi:hypothetical protein